MLIFGACHGLAKHNRKYYFDSLNDKFLPIYYDGMFFYDKTNNLCEYQRKTKKFLYSKEIFDYLNQYLKNDNFKKELENEFYKLIQRKDDGLFEYYWNYVYKNLKKYEILFKKYEILRDSNYSKSLFKEVNIFEKLKQLELPYPTIFYYQDIENNQYRICFEWFDINEDVYLISADKKNIYKNDQGCRKVEKSEIINLIKNDVFFNTNLDTRIRIYPIFIGNILNNYLALDSNDLILEKIDLEKIKNLNKILLQPGTILEIKIKDDANIDNLNFFSSKLNNSAVILRGKDFKINNVSFKEVNNKFANSVIETRNVTGCLNILNSKFHHK